MDIIINQGFQRYLIKVDLIKKDEVCEQYRVYAAKAPDKYIILENNRPLIRDRYKLKKRRIDWKQTSGKTMSVKTRAEIIKKIETANDIEKVFPTIQSTAKTRRQQFNKPGPTLGERKRL